METVWSLDYCLTCDRPTTGEAYCSQMCRLADLDSLSHFSRSDPPTPTQMATPAATTLPPAPSPTSGFFLPPAFDFSAYRRATPPPPSSRPSSSGSSSVAAPQSDASTSSPRILTPVSGHSNAPGSSLGAASAHPQDEGLSPQTKSELRDYINSFDTVRRSKRQLTG